MQYLHFLGRAGDDLARGLDLIVFQADLQLRQADDGAVLILRLFREAPQHRLDAGQHLAGAERLDDVVVRAQFQAEDAVDLLALGREHDDGDGAGLADGAAHVDARHARHHQIQHHHVGVQALHHFQGLLPVIRGLMLVPFGTQIQPQRLMHHRVIVADQDQRVHRHILTSKAHICTVLVLLLYTLSRSIATVVEKSLNKIIFDSILKPKTRQKLARTPFRGKKTRRSPRSAADSCKDQPFNSGCRFSTTPKASSAMSTARAMSSSVRAALMKWLWWLARNRPRETHSATHS